MFSKLPGVSLICCELAFLCRCWARWRLLRPWRLRWRRRLCGIWIRHAYMPSACLKTSKHPDGRLPSRALKAGSSCPPLARNTALTITASIEGNASFNVFSACCSGANGRGGLGGGASSPVRGFGFSGEEAGFGEDDDVSIGSSSKSSAFAVVGDSGRASGCCCLSVGTHFSALFAKVPYRFLWI